jgi:hypothetical protein
VKLLRTSFVLCGCAFVLLGCGAEPSPFGPHGLGLGGADAGSGSGGAVVMEMDAGSGGAEMDAPIANGTGGSGTGGSVMDAPAEMAVEMPVPMDTPPEAPAPFTCNQVMGGRVVSEFVPVLETMLDSAHWQDVSMTNAYLELWGDPNNNIWKTAVMSACTAGSANPDRVLLVTYSPNLKTEMQFHDAIDKAVATIKVKFPGVKRIELLTSVRSTKNQPCPGHDDMFVLVPAYVDSAIAAAAAASAGEVVAGLKVEADCNSFMQANADLTMAGATMVGQAYADYYKLHP